MKVIFTGETEYCSYDFGYEHGYLNNLRYIDERLNGYDSDFFYVTNISEYKEEKVISYLKSMLDSVQGDKKNDVRDEEVLILWEEENSRVLILPAIYMAIYLKQYDIAELLIKSGYSINTATAKAIMFSELRKCNQFWMQGSSTIQGGIARERLNTVIISEIQLFF